MINASFSRATLVFRLLTNRANLDIQHQQHRNFKLSVALALKKVQHTISDDGKTITIEGVYTDSPRLNQLIDFERLQNSTHFPAKKVPALQASSDEKKSKDCPLCKLGVEVKHTDVLILEQFLDPFGGIIPRKVSGLCSIQQRRINYLIEMSKQAGLLKTPTDPEPTKRRGYLKYNKYYDESVIAEFLKGTRRRH